MKHHAIALSFLFLSTAARADVQPLPQSQWPRTAQEAVPSILITLSPTQRSIVGHTSKESLHLLKSEWGEDIGQLLGLNSGNTALIEATCGRPCFVDQATLMLMEAAWAALQQ
jgi:hypothetical protein